jgi:hypothetical protein
LRVGAILHLIDPRLDLPSSFVEIEDRERLIREGVLGLPPAMRRDLLRVIMAPEPERAAAIADLWAQRPADTIAELMIDLEEDRGIALEIATVLKDLVLASER